MPKTKSKSKNTTVKKYKNVSSNIRKYKLSQIAIIIMVILAGILTVLLSPVQNLIYGDNVSFATYEDMIGIVERGEYSLDIYIQTVIYSDIIIFSTISLLLLLSVLIYISDKNHRFKNFLFMLSIFLVAVFTATIFSLFSRVEVYSPTETIHRSSNDLDKLLLCADRINYVTNYDASYDDTGNIFYDLNDRGFKLDKTLQNEGPEKLPSQDSICVAYHELRMKNTADNIVLQPFILSPDGEVLPISLPQYQNSSEYLYGFFVKK